MRTFRRPHLTPPTLLPGGKGGNKAALNAEYFAKSDTESITFPSHWNEPDVRGALHAMQGRVCAYCSRFLERYDELEVEHFRPKGSVAGDSVHGGYWWLAYDFTNYFLSCRTCNAISTKGSKFPLLYPSAARATWHNRSTIASELRAFVDPCADVWLEDGFSVEDLTCVFHPNPGLSDECRNRFEYTCAFFHLNDDPLVMKARVQVQDLVLQALSRKETEVTRWACRFRPYSAVVRQLVKRKAPELLPTTEQELDFLLQELFEDLSSALELMERDRENKRAVQLCNLLMWTFAAIWKDPPARSPDWVEEFLRDQGLDVTVRKFYERL